MGRRIVLGSGNRAKLAMVRSIVEPAGFEVVAAGALGIEVHLDEVGRTAEENARLKALAYLPLVGEPVLAIDNALYLEGLPPERQPGLHVRRIPAATARPSDEALLDYYRRLIASLGEAVRGYWLFALVLACPEGPLFERSLRSPRLFVARPSPHRLEGYPLESLQIDPATGRYIAEMSEAERAAFWRRLLGDELLDLVREALGDEADGTAR